MNDSHRYIIFIISVVLFLMVLFNKRQTTNSQNLFLKKLNRYSKNCGANYSLTEFVSLKSEIILTEALIENLPGKLSAQKRLKRWKADG